MNKKSIQNISASEIAENYDWNESDQGDETQMNNKHKKEQLENPFSMKKQKTSGLSTRKSPRFDSEIESQQQPRTVKNYKTSKFESLQQKSDIELSQILEGVEFDMAKKDGDSIEYFKTGTINNEDYETGLKNNKDGAMVPGKPSARYKNSKASPGSDRSHQIKENVSDLESLESQGPGSPRSNYSGVKNQKMQKFMTIGHDNKSTSDKKNENFEIRPKFNGSQVQKNEENAYLDFRDTKTQWKRGENLHKSIIMRSATNKWEKTDGDNEHLRYDKMKAITILRHPHKVIDGEPKEVPFCISTGSMWASFQKQLYGFDDLGIAVSIYFKLLKAMTCFFIVCSILSIPLYYIFSNGDMYKQATSEYQMQLSTMTLGNLGESTTMCKQANLRVYDTITLWCPAGTNIKALKKFGLQKKDAKEGDNYCPQIVEKGDSDENEDGKNQALKLDLDYNCSLKGLEREFPEYYTTMMLQFEALCMGKSTCDMYVRNIDWPKPCRELIGVRLQVVNIPIVRYVKSGISEVKTIEKDKEAQEKIDKIVNQTETALNDLGKDKGDAELDSTKEKKLEEEVQEKVCERTVEIDPATGEKKESGGGQNCTSTVTTFIEYKQAYEYVISDQSTSFYLYGTVECSNENIELHGYFEGENINRTDVGLIAVIIDLAIMTIFLFMLWMLSYFVKVDSERHKNLLFETQEFSIQVENLPRISEDYPIEMLKAELWDHFEKQLKEETQKIMKLRSSDVDKAYQIVDIQFAMSDYQYLESVVHIKKYSQEIEIVDLKIKECEPNTSKMAKLEQQKFQLLQEIDLLKQRYFVVSQEMNKQNQPVTCFILFRSMEGVERAKHAFNTWKFTRIWFSIFTCCTTMKQKSKLFKKKWLRVKPAVEPELLIWQNFGITRTSKCLRLIFYIVFVITTLVVCFYIIYFLEQLQNEASSQIPDIQCPATVEVSAANLDYYANFKVRNGDFHCFCKNLFTIEGYTFIKDFKFPLDGKAHCYNWYTEYAIVIFSVIGIALLIIIANVLVEVLIQFGTKLTRPVNEQNIITNAVRAISWIQFINLGLVLLIIGMNVKIGKWLSWAPTGFLQGDYEDISSMWYIDVGTQIILAMILEVGAPHILPVSHLIIYSVKRAWDRSCTCDKKKSKKYLQSEYEELYTGPEFHLDARLAQIIAITWTTFMYSPGLPILFIIAAINFFIIYWIDKWLILRFYRTPKNYDEESIVFTIDQMKWSFYFHILIGATIFSNKRILSSDSITDLITNEYTEGQQALFQLSSYNSFHTILFLVGNFLLIILMIFQQTILAWLSRNITCFKNFQTYYEQMDAISDDYYNEISLKFLINEYERTKHEKQRIKGYQNKQQNLSQFEVANQVLNKHLNRLDVKQKDIQIQFNKLCKLIAIDEPTISERIRQLQINVEALTAAKNYRIKSKVQTYDIRDCEEYYGILELENLLKRSSRHKKTVGQDAIQRTASLRGKTAVKTIDQSDSLAESGIDMDNELMNNQEVEEDKTNHHDTVVMNDQTKMTLTIGLDGLMDSPDTKSIFKNSKGKVHPKINDDYRTNDRMVKQQRKEKPKLDYDYSDRYGNGVDATIVPDSGKYDTRSRFNLRDELEDSKNGLQSQESVFDTKKKSTSSNSDIFKDKFKNTKFSYGDD